MTTHTASPGSPPLSPQRRSLFRWRPDQQWEAYLFILPSLLGFLIFVVLAVGTSLFISFSDWGLTGYRGWAGFANYRTLVREPLFWRTIQNTIFYIVTIVPAQLALGLVLALALNQAIRGRLFYRMVYFLPVVTTVVAGAIVFRLLFSTNGPVNDFLVWAGGLVGIPVLKPNWLGNSPYARWSVMLFTVWKNAGFTMVVYLAALQGVPRELYDAAETDGANAWQRFLNVTLPLISPTTFFLLILQMIGAFQLFTEPFVLTPSDGGAPNNSTMTVVQYIYFAAFRDIRLNKASAMAWFLFIFVFGVTLLQNWLQKRWVHYES